ncbi:MAG TPA: CHASE domain-containing protein, partial [Solirubrobacterales bacterium]|nr:CHASE domain-containing protein [Solirubrobacterales bacterium]
MRLRFWIGLLAAVVVGAGAVVGSILVYNHDSDEFHTRQREEAQRAAKQAQAVGALTVGELASAASFIKADGNISKHEFAIVGQSLVKEELLQAAAFIDVVHADERARYERVHGFPIVEKGASGRFVKAKPAAIYYPLTYRATKHEGFASKAMGYNVAAEPERAPYLLRAANDGKATATPVISLPLGGQGINVFRAVYRDGAPIATPAERRRALIGWAAGSFLLKNLAAAAVTSLPDNVTTQFDVANRTVIGPEGQLEDSSAAPFQIADHTWVLVVRDPNRPDGSLPILFGAAGLALAAVLGSLIYVWSREERMRKLQ